MSSRNRSSRRTGNQNENEQNTNSASQVPQGSMDHQNAGETYLSAIERVLERLDEVVKDVKKNSDNIEEQVKKIGQVQATADRNSEEIRKLRQELEEQRNNPSIQLIQTIKTQLQQETLGPSYQADILSYSNQLVINGIPYSARNLDLPLAQTVVTEMLAKMNLPPQDLEYLKPVDAHDINKGGNENMIIIAHFRNAQAVNQILKAAARIPRGITITKSLPPTYRKKYTEFRKVCSQWSKMIDPNRQRTRKSKITFENGWMILSYSEKTGHDTWTPWKKYDTFYPPPEHFPPPQRQTAEGDIYQAHQLIFNQPQTQDRVNKIMENIRNKPGVANISFTNSGWSATITLYNPTPQNLINEIRNDPSMDQLKPTITIQPNTNFIQSQQLNLPPEIRENLTHENEERSTVEVHQPEAGNIQTVQNDTNVMDTERNRQNNTDEIHTLEVTDVTLDERADGNKENTNPDARQEPETPEDILKSPTKDKDTDDTSGKKAQ